MLDDYKRSYEECANLIKDWKSISSIDLCDNYIKNLEIDPDKSQAYLSAVICRYWYIIQRTYYAQRIKLASEEDVYDWFIEGLYNALNHHVWTDPNNKLYGDEKGPEKAISVCIYSAKLNYFQSLEYDKRKTNKYALSLEELEEDSSDDYYLPYYDQSPFMKMYMYEKVRKMFFDYDYFSAFLLDAIVNVEVFSKEENKDYATLSLRKLLKYLRNIDDRYIKIFSNIYDLDEKDVIQAVEFIKNLPSERMIRNITNLLFLLRRDKELINYIRS